MHRILQLLPFVLAPLLFACSHVRVSQKAIHESDGFFVKYKKYELLGNKEAKSDENERGVVILPATGGSNYLDHRYAKSLSSQGAIVKIITSYSGSDEKSYDLKVHERIHKKALRSLDLVLKTFDSNDKVSLLGTSLGGLYATLATREAPIKQYLQNISSSFNGFGSQAGT